MSGTAPLTDEHAQLRTLLIELADTFENEGRSGGTLAAERLRASRPQDYRSARSASDPGALLETACAIAGALPMSRHVLACRTLLDWTLWEGEGLAADVSSRLFSAELLGPDGHFPAEDVRVGLLLSDAETDYPVSNHSGEETYLVLAGTAEWTVEETPYTNKPPGALIHHPAWALHGRRTLQQPFLGAWRWSGDLDLTSFSVHEQD